MIYILQRPDGLLFVGTADEARASRLIDLANAGLSVGAVRRALRSPAGWKVVGQTAGDVAKSAEVRERFAARKVDGFTYQPDAAMRDWVAASTDPWDGEEADQLGVERPKPTQGRPVPVSSGLGGRLARKRC